MTKNFNSIVPFLVLFKMYFLTLVTRKNHVRNWFKTLSVIQFLKKKLSVKEEYIDKQIETEKEREGERERERE